MKKYEIEIGSTTRNPRGLKLLPEKTYRTYYVSADSQEEAEEIALREVGLDFEIPKEWAENAEVTCINGEEK